MHALGPAAATAPFKNRHLSVSRVKKYATCPRSFFFAYVEPVAKELRIEDPESPASFGSATHDALEAIYRRVVADHVVGEIPRDLIVPAWKEAFFKRGLAHPELYREGLRILRLYADRHTVDWRAVAGIEEEFQLRFDEFAVTGRIDRIDRDRSDRVRVVDYKSSMRAFTGEELEEDVQMSIYGLVALERYPEVEEVSFSFHMIRLGFEQTVTRTRRQLDDAREYLVEVGRLTERDREFRPILNSNCGYCEFRGVCPAYKEALAKRHPKVAAQDDMDAVAKEYTRVAAIANAAYARKKELEVLIKGAVAMSVDPPKFDGKTWDLHVQPQTEYDVEKVVGMAAAAGVAHDRIAELVRLSSASKEKVETWLKSLDGGVDGYLVLKREVEVLGLRPLAPKVMLRSKVVK